MTCSSLLFLLAAGMGYPAATGLHFHVSTGTIGLSGGSSLLKKDFFSTHVAIAAVLDGTIEGEVWVDRPVEPRVAPLANGDAYYLAGLPGAAGDSFAYLKELISDWAYFFVEDRWSALLGEIWSNRFARPHPRVRMGLPGAGDGLAATVLPDGFRLVQIDQRLLDLEPGNIETVTDLIEGWASPELFLENAVGFCVLHDGSVASHCATDSVSGTRCEVGVGTEPAYRRLGFGKAAAAATITECIKRGRPDIEWHTHASNKGSIAIARSIGLIERDRHVAYSGNLPAENVGDLDLATCREWGLHLERASDHIN